MAQVKFDFLTDEWIAFPDIVENFDSSLKYQVQNRGADSLIGLEVSTQPNEQETAGDLVLPNKVWTYEPEEGKTMYFRAFNKNCSINITTKGE